MPKHTEIYRDELILNYLGEYLMKFFPKYAPSVSKADLRLTLRRVMLQACKHQNLELSTSSVQGSERSLSSANPPFVLYFR